MIYILTKLIELEKKKNHQCIELGCLLRATFNIKGRKAIYCKAHRTPLMIDVRHPSCIEKECKINPCFNFKDEKQAIYCEEHRKPNMVNVTRISCKENECQMYGYYNFENKTSPLYCYVHKKEGMVNPNIKTCMGENCNIQPVFNYKNEKQGLYCFSHRKENMINVRDINKKCLDCDIGATYNYVNESNAIYCSKHSKENMVKIHKKTCQEEDCDIGPTYNYKDKTDPLYCKKHKLKDMIDISHDKCKECDKRPNYNYESEKKGLYCKTHRLQTMIDVVHPKCTKCSLRPYYGIPGNKAIVCSQHKESKMIASPKTRCISEKCKEIAIYGIGKTQLHCENHKEEDEINLIENECNKCKLPNILNSSELCCYCDPENGIKVKLSKQYQVRDYLLAKNYKYISSDKVIDNSDCGKERPDFLFDCGTHYIVVEIDENQHNDRISNCEITRMKNISSSLGMQTLFIRYNPDVYKFGHKNLNPNFNKRITDLEDFLNYYMKIDVEELNNMGYLSVIYLCYNNYIKQDVKPQILVEFDN